ncbi:MAG TPA: RnfABCDGE type electron transport complex subunit D [Candidatus Saccharimonadales bacterium]|nr:RnfABCDGE type electron transport complex subunit D [Candidatus Saccharimonadales bacterium]
MRLIDSLLDRITMYRLLVYYLLVLVAAAVILSGFGLLTYSPGTIIASTAYLVGLCWVVNTVFARVYRAPNNVESYLITALILALILTPVASMRNLVFLTAAGGLAMSSKYILAIRKQHVFNPAAVAVVLTALGAGQSASWWVGSLPLLSVVVVGGLLLVRKIQRLELVLTFLGTALVATLGYNLLGGQAITAGLQQTLLHSSLFFLAFVMLTEPLTSPRTAAKQRWYGVLAGLLFPPQVHLGTLYSTPELVLVVSNIFSHVIDPPVKLLPRLVQRVRLAPDVMDFVFTADRKFSFQAGQYMEWTLPHPHADTRGNRRFFTLASSPTEENIRLGLKFYENGSSFKQAMRAMDRTTPIAAAQLGGDFVLPKDRRQKLVFIAGGIGITPYRSMMKYLLDTGDTRAVTLLYSERNAAEVVYREVFDVAAQRPNTRVVYCLTDSNTVVPAWARAGFITSEMITAEIPDYRERLFYISGPHSMVTAMTEILRELGIDDSHIKIDFFPGYA